MLFRSGDDTVPYSDGVKIRLFTYDHELDFSLVSPKWSNFHLLPANHEHQLRKYRHEKMGIYVLQTLASTYFIREVLKQQLVQPAPGVLLQAEEDAISFDDWCVNVT